MHAFERSQIEPIVRYSKCRPQLALHRREHQRNEGNKKKITHNIQFTHTFVCGLIKKKKKTEKRTNTQIIYARFSILSYSFVVYIYAYGGLRFVFKFKFDAYANKIFIVSTCVFLYIFFYLESRTRHLCFRERMDDPSVHFFFLRW